MRNILIIPKISEKSVVLAQSKTYVFYAPIDATKKEVSAAVEKRYEVKVKDTRLMIHKGKAKKSYQKRKQPISGKRADRKIAYVKLSAGEIKIFEGGS